MLLTSDHAFAEFSENEGWRAYEPTISGLVVPDSKTRKCLEVARNRRLDEINRRASDYNSGIWTRAEVQAAVDELNAETARLELQHCGTVELLPIIVT